MSAMSYLTLICLAVCWGLVRTSAQTPAPVQRTGATSLHPAYLTCRNNSEDAALIQEAINSHAEVVLTGNCNLGSTTLTVGSNFTLEGTATLHYAPGTQGTGFAVQSDGNYDTIRGLTFDGGGVNLSLSDWTNWTGQYGWTIENNTFKNVTSNLTLGGMQAIKISNILGKGPASAANSISYNRFYNIWAEGYPNFPPVWNNPAVDSTVWTCGPDCMQYSTGIWFENGIDNTKIDYNYFEDIGGDAIKGFWDGFLGNNYAFVAHNVEIAHNTMVGVHRIGIEVQANGKGNDCPGGCNDNQLTSDGTVIKDNFFHAPAFASDPFAYSLMVGGSNVLVLNNTGVDEDPNNYWPLGIGLENSMDGGVMQGNVISSVYVKNAGNYNWNHGWAGAIVSGYTFASVTDNFFNNVGCGDGLGSTLVWNDPDNYGTMNEQADYSSHTCASNPASSNITLSFSSDGNQTSTSAGPLTFQVGVESALSIEQVQFFLDNSSTPITTQEVQDFNPDFAANPLWLYHVALPAGTPYGQHTITAVAIDVAGTKKSAAQQFDYEQPQVSAPNAPANVAVAAGNGQVAVTWSAVPGTTYSVFRSTTSGGEGTAPIASNLVNASFTDTGLTNGTTYFYEMSASNPAGVSPMSGESSATPAAPGASGGGALSGNFAPAVSMTYNFTGLGTVDWAAWGLGGGNAYPHFDHKASGNGQISDVGIVGSGAAWGDWSGYNTGKLSWLDGAPDTTATNEDGFYWSNGGVGTGFSFTAPADTNVRTLTVYAGACDASLKLVAHLSDNSASDFTDSSLVNQCSGGSSQAVYTLVYSAASAGQTLTISLIKAAGSNGGSVNLMGATLANGAIAVTAAPTITATAGNGRVTLSWGAVAGAISYNVYRATAQGGTLSVPPINTLSTSYVDTSVTNGTTYYYAVQAVSAIGGSPLSAEQSATPLAPVFGSGSVTASFAAPLSSNQAYNLTSIGTSDWAAWGEDGQNHYPHFDHKLSGNGQISDVTSFGKGANPGDWNNYGFAGLTWNDGTPDPTATNENGYDWTNGAVGTGLSFTVPADTTTRHLWVYAGACGATAEVTAHLSDGSGADFVDTASLQNTDCSSKTTSGVYVFTYHAGSADQTLTINIIKYADFNGGYGSANLIGAALY